MLVPAPLFQPGNAPVDQVNITPQLVKELADAFEFVVQLVSHPRKNGNQCAEEDRDELRGKCQELCVRHVVTSFVTETLPLINIVTTGSASPLTISRS